MGIFALSCPDFTICTIFTLYMHSSVETKILHCKRCRAIGPLFMDILHFKDLGDTSVISECSFVC